MDLVLASASTARAGILEAAGVSFVSRPADMDEAALKAKLRADQADPGTAAIALATAKAVAISANVPDALVLAADQILVMDKDWFDKPPDRMAARRQLRRLRGRAHDLVTGVVGACDGLVVWDYVETAHLVMRPFSDAFLDRYLSQAGETILSSVGAYRLEGLGAQLFERIDGDFFTILGLPLWPVLDFLRGHGVLRI